MWPHSLQTSCVYTELNLIYMENGKMISVIIILIYILMFMVTRKYGKRDKSFKLYIHVYC